MSPRHVALLGSLAAIWGGSYLLIKYALEDLSAPMIVWARTAIAAVVLFVALGGATRGVLGDMRRRPGWAALLGTISVTAPFLLITFGELEVPSGLTAVLISPAALFVALFAPFIDPSERINRRQAIGLFAGLGGVAIVVGVESISTLWQFLGALAMVGAAAFYALGSFVVKGRYGRLTSMQTSFVSLSVASLTTLPIAIATAPSDMPGMRAILSVLALGAIGTALAFVIFYKLIAEVGAGRASLVSYLAPGVALFYGAVFLDEAITLAAIAGLVLILGGVALASRRRPQPVEPVACPDHGPEPVAAGARVP
ncbi:MAG: DMT family transporter [Actinomycetota bacterium]|nr:DMT family transporter [Actinomycetota bacterium]